MPQLPSAVLPKRPFATRASERRSAYRRSSSSPRESTPDAVYARLRTRAGGLTPEEASERLAASAPLERTTITFLGTSVESGASAAVVVSTGKDTYLGGMAQSLQQQPTPTAFDPGNDFGVRDKTRSSSREG
jgi:magnesium-transporting ATPase (P-type)